MAGQRMRPQAAALESNSTKEERLRPLLFSFHPTPESTGREPI
jgi:hypothetical protein